MVIPNKINVRVTLFLELNKFGSYANSKDNPHSTKLT